MNWRLYRTGPEEDLLVLVGVEYKCECVGTLADARSSYLLDDWPTRWAARYLSELEGNYLHLIHAATTKISRMS